MISQRLSKPTAFSTSPLRRIYFYFKYLVFRLLVFIANHLTHSTCNHLAGIIGSILFLRKKRRMVSMHNLRLAFPEKSEKALEEIARASMQGLVKVVFEFVRIPRIVKRPDLYIEIKGGEHVHQALQQGRGLIVTVSHFGNWELMGIAAAANGFPLHAIGKPLENPFIYDFIERLRGITGLRHIRQGGAVRACVRLIKENQMIAMLIDENARKGAVRVDFFGRKAATSGLPAMLALKYNVPIIPTYYYREENKRSVLFFGKPFVLIKTGNYEADIQANTQQYASSLQAEIIKRPGDWTLWMHNRWKEHVPGAFYQRKI